MPIPYTTTASLPYGSRVVTVDSVGYIANNFSTSQSLNVIERTDSLGAPNGAVGIQQARTGSAQLQLATSTTTIPDVGDEFTANSVTFFLTEVSRPEEAQGFKVVDISFRESV
jgi:hypothetical protein